MVGLFRKAGIIAASVLLVNSPLIALELEMSQDAESAAEGLLSIEKQTPVLFESFTSEYSKAGRLTAYPQPLVEESSGVLPVFSPGTSKTEPLIISLIDQAEAAADIYISAGPDGYGFAGSVVYIGSEERAPEGVTFLWSQTAGPEADLADPSAYQTYFIPRLEGVYTFMICAELPGGGTSADTATVLIDDPAGNSVPSACAGDDQYIGLIPGNSCSSQLQGTGFDADGDVLNFFWEQTSGPQAEILSDASGRADCVFTEPGLYMFALTVSDGITVSIPDEVFICVYQSGNLPPVAVSEDQRTEFDGTPQIIVLDASGSYDPDGDPLSYTWEQIDGRPIVLEDNTGPLPLFTCKNEGSYIFKLTVDDGLNLSAPVTVSVVAAPAENEAAYGCSSARGSADAMVFLILTIVLLLSRRRREWERRSTV